MKNEIGLWIDHKKAVIVRLMDGSVETIASNIDNVFQASGSHGNVGMGAKDYPAEDIHDRHKDQMLGEYYEKVAKALKTPDHIFVMGPGEAKIEFTHKLGSSIEMLDGVEAADRMTDRQIIARVRRHFAHVA